MYVRRYTPRNKVNKNTTLSLNVKLRLDFFQGVTRPCHPGTIKNIFRQFAERKGHTFWSPQMKLENLGHSTSNTSMVFNLCIVSLNLFIPMSSPQIWT